MSRLARRALETCRPKTVVSGEAVLGSASVSGVINWTVPAGVYSVSILMVHGGAGGEGGQTGTASTVGAGGLGGLSPNNPGVYRNDYEVNPGDVLSFTVGAGRSANAYGWGRDTSQAPTSLFGVASGWTQLSTTTITAQGGAAGSLSYVGGNGGGGVAGRSLVTPNAFPGSLSNGSAGTSGGSARGGAGGPGGWPGGAGGGGGGGTRLDNSPGGVGGAGANGAVRIIWGAGRSFPDNAA